MTKVISSCRPTFNVKLQILNRKMNLRNALSDICVSFGINADMISFAKDEFKTQPEKVKAMPTLPQLNMFMQYVTEKWMVVAKAAIAMKATTARSSNPTKATAAATAAASEARKLLTAAVTGTTAASAK